MHCDIYEHEKRGHTAFSDIESSSVTLKTYRKEQELFFTKNRLCIPIGNENLSEFQKDVMFAKGKRYNLTVAIYTE